MTARMVSVTFAYLGGSQALYLDKTSCPYQANTGRIVIHEFEDLVFRSEQYHRNYATQKNRDPSEALFMLERTSFLTAWRHCHTSALAPIPAIRFGAPVLAIYQGSVNAGVIDTGKGAHIDSARNWTEWALRGYDPMINWFGLEKAP